MKNPLSAQVFGSLKVSTLDGSKVIDQQLSNIYLPATTTTSQAGTACSISNGVNTIGSSGAEYTFEFTTVNPYPYGSYIVITVPSTMTIPSTFTSWTFKKFTTSVTATFTQISTTQVQIYGIWTNEYVAPASDYTVVVGGWTNPSTTATQSLTMAIYETTSGTGKIVDTFTSFKITCKQGTITVSSIYATDNQQCYETPSSYTFVFSAQTAISSGYTLSIVMSSDFTLSTTTCTASSSQFDATPSCSMTASTNTITISSMTTIGIAAATSITLTVSNIRNPCTTAKLGAITINVYDASNNLLDKGTYSIAANYYTYNSITTFTATAVSKTTALYPASYTFTVTPKYKMPLKSYLVITLPADIGVYNKQQISLSCGGSISGFTATSLYCTASSTTINVQGFQNSASTSDPPTMTFTIPQLINPRSTATTAAFGLSIYDSNNGVIYKWSSTTAPTVQMTTPIAPYSLTFTRGSTTNGATTNYDFNLTVNSTLQTSDIVYIIFPSNVTISSSINCTGITRMQATLYCVANQTANSVAITLGLTTSRILSTITLASNNTMSFRINGILNPPSTKPAGSITYLSQTSAGYSIEQLSTGGPTIINTIAGTILASKASVYPDNYITSNLSTYYIQFVPTNYVQNMYVTVKIPTQISMNSSSISCSGLSGTDNSTVTCTSNSTANTITFTGAFKNQASAPSNITLAINSLTNPSSKLDTDSFVIQTFTSDGYSIDSISTGLEVDFICEYPCKTCSNSTPTQCYSCYSFSSMKYLYSQQCLSSCPSGYYGEASDNACQPCNSPCSQCTGTADTCTACVSPYWLSGNECLMQGPLQTKGWFYPYPFAALSGLLSVIIFFTIICHTQTKFLNSVISLVALPELLSWVWLGYLQWFYGGNILIFFVLCGAAGLHVVLNISYGLAHQKSLVPKADEDYRLFIKRYRGCNNATLFFSVLLTFKFHLITQSFCANGRHLKGVWNPAAWGVWNGISLTYLFTSYPAIMTACGWELIFRYSIDQYTLIWYVSIEVAAISTYVALLLLILTCVHCHCGCTCCHGEDEDEEEKKGYNKVHADSVMQDSFQKTTKEGRMKYLDSDLDKVTSRDREIELLREQIALLKAEKSYITDGEKKEILKEREKIEESKKNPKKDTAMNEEGRNPQVTKEEKRKLEALRKEFLQVANKRIQKEDWERDLEDTQHNEDHEKVDKGTMTNLRYHQIPQMKVDAGFESEKVTLARNAQFDRSKSLRGNGRNQGNNSKDTTFKKSFRETQLQQDYEDYPETERRMYNNNGSTPIHQNDEIGPFPAAYQETPRQFKDELLDKTPKRAVGPIYGKFPFYEKLRPTVIQMEASIVSLPKIPAVFLYNNDENFLERNETQIANHAVKQSVHEWINEVRQSHDQQLYVNQTRNNAFRAEATPREIEQNQMHIENPKAFSRQVTPNTNERSAQQEMHIEQQLKPVSRAVTPIEKQTFQQNEMQINQQPNGVSRAVTPIEREEQKHEEMKIQDQPKGVSRPVTPHELQSESKEIHKPIKNQAVRESIEKHMEYDQDEVVHQSPEQSPKQQQEQVEQHPEPKKQTPQPYKEEPSKPQTPQRVPTPVKESQPQPKTAEKQQPPIKPKTPEKQQQLVKPKSPEKQQPPSKSKTPEKVPPKAQDQKQPHQQELDQLDEIKMEEEKAPADDNLFEAVDAGEGEQAMAPSQQPTTPKKDNQQQPQQPQPQPEIPKQKSNDPPSSQPFRNKTPEKTQPQKVPDQNKIQPSKQEVEQQARKKKKILYSDKSESSVDEMMEDTPSNYNIPNGRMDGKSLGLKAMLLHAKKMGLNLQGAIDDKKSPELNKGGVPDSQKQFQSPQFAGNNRLGIDTKLGHEEAKKFASNIIQPGQQQQHSGYKALGNQKLNLASIQQQREDSGSDAASWRAFNKPMGKPQVVGEELDGQGTQDEGANNINTLEGGDRRAKKGGTKKRQAVSNNKQFKEPNMERIGQLESAYMAKPPRQQQQSPQPVRGNQLKNNFI